MKRSWWLAVAAAASLSLAVPAQPAPAAEPQSPPDRAIVPAPRAALGAVTLGRVAPTATTACIDDYLWYQAFSDPYNPSYTVPFPGVVTTVQHFANENVANIQAVFLKATTTDFVHDVAHRSPVLTLAPNRLNTLPVRIPVQAGEVLALRTVSGSARCEAPGGTIDQDYAGDLDATATTWGPLATSHVHVFVNISAVLEPDLDGDGYGDVSQDLCPEVAATQAACPLPVTKVTKQPRKTIAKTKNKLVFTSSVPGSSFACSIDGKRFKACASPLKKRFLPGRHVVLIRAISRYGQLEVTPTMVRFTVESGRH